MILWAPDVTSAERDALLAALAALRAGTVVPGLELVSQRLLRCVARIRLRSGRSVYLKLHRLPRAKDRLRYALRRLPGVAEFVALQRLRGLGIAGPRALGCAGVRDRALVPRESWLATEAVAAGGTPVTLVEALGVIDQLARHGWHHPDLHPANLLRGADGAVVLLDLQSLRRGRGAHARFAMRARCLLGFAQRDARPLEDAAAIAQESGLWSPAEARALVSAASRMHARWLLSRARRPWVESSEFTVHGGWIRTWSRRSEPVPAIGAVVARVSVGALACTALRSGDPAVLGVAGPAALRRAWTGDAWRVLRTQSPPRVLACRRLGPWPWSRSIVFLRATAEDWPDVVAQALTAAEEVDRLARSYRRREPSPCVTLLLQAGYNPARSVPSAL